MKTTVRAEELDEVWAGARYGLGLLRIDLTAAAATTATPGT
ncbi:hypothetical protein ABZ690_35955 [Streptomyces sp. NPDC006967]|nr:hypothetical protein [Streptomyces sp. SM1]